MKIFEPATSGPEVYVLLYGNCNVYCYFKKAIYCAAFGRLNANKTRFCYVTLKEDNLSLQNKKTVNMTVNNRMSVHWMAYCKCKHDTYLQTVVF